MAIEFTILKYGGKDLNTSETRNGDWIADATGDINLVSQDGPIII